jgi:hypothetical protein
MAPTAGNFTAMNTMPRPAHKHAALSIDRQSNVTGMNRIAVAP